MSYLNVRKSVLVFIFLFSLSFTNAQSGYKISVNLKNSNIKDTIAFLTYYQMDKTYIKDTCRNFKDGKIVFQGKDKLPRGIYSVVNQNKSIIFDMFVDEQTQFLKLEADANTYTRQATVENSKQESDFFKYIAFLTEKNTAFLTEKNLLKGLTKKDSLARIIEMQKTLDRTIEDYEARLAEENKGTYFGDFINLKREKTLKDVPLASNGRPDSLKVYKYYRTHYWDGVSFKDEEITRNPFFSFKLKKYFDTVIFPHPDSVTVEIDRIMSLPDDKSLLYKLLLAHFTATYETSQVMGFEKVFVHMVDCYFKKGKAVGTYDEDVIDRIIKRADKLRPLLLGAVAPELYMIKPEDRDKIAKMGFENVKSSDEVTRLFYSHANEINPLFYKLSDVKADYLVLVFWDVDCGHCQKEIPKLLDLYHEYRNEKKDVKVFSVYTQHEMDKYLKYLNEKNLDWINVYDGVHYNNLAERYDIYATPVVYVLDRNKVIKARRIDVERIRDIVKDMEAEYKKGK